MATYYWVGQNSTVISGITNENNWNEKENWVLRVEGNTYGLESSSTITGKTLGHHFVAADKFPSKDDHAIFTTILGEEASGIFNTGVTGHTFDTGAVYISPLSACKYGGRTNTGSTDSPTTSETWGNSSIDATYPSGSLRSLTIEYGYTYDVGDETGSSVAPYNGLNLPVTILDSKPGRFSGSSSFDYYYGVGQQIRFDNSDITHAKIDGEGFTTINRSYLKNIAIYGRKFEAGGDHTPHGNVVLQAITCGNAINISGEYALPTAVRQSDWAGFNIKGNTIPNINIYTGYRSYYGSQVVIAANVTNLNIYPSKASNYEADWVKLIPGVDMTVENLKMHYYNPIFDVTGDATNPSLTVATKATFDNIIMESGILKIEDDMHEEHTVTVIDGEMNGLSIVNTRATKNPYYEGFRIGLDKTEADEGILINSEDATILFSTGMHVLAGHYGGATGTDESFATLTPKQH